MNESIMNESNESDLIELYCDFILNIPNSESEAFNLISVINGKRIAYLIKENNYIKDINKYQLLKEYISNLTFDNIGYSELDINSIASKKLIVYNTNCIENNSYLFISLEQLINNDSNDSNRKEYISNLLEHMCHTNTNNITGSIEFFIKNCNKTIYKEYCQELPDNNLIEQKKQKFQEIGDILSLIVDVRTTRYISDNDICDIILKKNPTEYMNYKREIHKYLKKHYLHQTSMLIDRIINSNNPEELMLKYHRKIAVLVTITSYPVLSPFTPLQHYEKTLIDHKYRQMENDIYKMNITKLSTKKLSIITISYIKEIILSLHQRRYDENLYRESNQIIEDICKELNEHN